MNIEDVLLTDDEIDRIVAKNNPYFIGERQAIAKAAQLKLLEWLKGTCYQHNYVCFRFDCPDCWSELESKLKEGR